MPNRINHLAVWVAAIVYFLFGALWYSLLFKTAWMSYQGITVAMTAGKSANPMVFVVSFIMGLILAYATGIALSRRPEDQTAQQGISFALFMGIALYATQLYNQFMYEQRPFGLFLIDAGYVVIGFAIIGAIVGGWKRKVAV